MKQQQNKPSLIAFEVTRQCRYACRHCRANAVALPPDDQLTTEQCKRILKSVADFSKCMLILTGGEPMERTDIYELIEYAAGLGLRTVMATCGYLIDESSIERLKTSGIQALSFSIDGASPETHDAFRQAPGAFDAVIKAAQVAKHAGLRFQINTTISKINIDEAVSIAELAKRLGAYCFNPFIFVPTGRGEQIAHALLDPLEYEMLLNEMLEMKLESGIKIRVTCAPGFARLCAQKRFRQLDDDVSGCMGGRGFGFISARGDVQACGFLDISAGNLLQNSFNFEKIWTQSQLLIDIRDLSKYKDTCGDCEYVGICGGCRARAFALSGDYLGEDPICNYPQKGY